MFIPSYRVQIPRHYASLRFSPKQQSINAWYGAQDNGPDLFPKRIEAGNIAVISCFGLMEIYGIALPRRSLEHSQRPILKV